MTHKEAHEKLAEMMDSLSAIAQDAEPSLAKELEQAHQHIHMSYIKVDEILYPLGDGEKSDTAMVPCDDCGVPVPYYDGKTLCDKCYATHVKALEV